MRGGGIALAWLIDFFNAKEQTQITYSFIDDAKSALSLEALHKEIGECEVLISSMRFYEKLVDNLLRFKIKHFSNGIAKYAKKLNVLFREFKGIGFILDDYSSQKHFGVIDSMLKDRGYALMYFQLAHSYESVMRKDALLIVMDFLPYLQFCTVLIGTALYYNIHPNVRYMHLFSSYYIPRFHSYYHTKEHNARTLTAYEIASFSNHYIVCSNARSYACFAEFFDRYNGNKERLLKLGYPSLDKEVEAYAKEKESLRDSIIVPSMAVHRMPKETAKQILEALLESYRVVYKTHNGHPERFEEEKEFCRQFRDRENFVFYTQPNLEAKELKRSITLIETTSSLLYTYPLITLKPSIIMYPYEREDNFYEKQLHLKAFSVEDVLGIIMRLQDVSFAKEREEMIRDYRANEAYCFAKSSESIVDFVEQYLQKYKGGL